MKILINTPNYKRPELGGVANHFYGLKPYWTENVRYNIVGSRNKTGRGKYWLPYDLLKTIFIIIFWRPDMVMVNTSLGSNALRRDSIFLNLAHFMGKKVVVHFHGFNINYAKKINVQHFLKMFRYAEGYIVLASNIKNQLQEWGVKAPIFIGTTKVDNRMIENHDDNSRDGNIRNIMYLGRVETEKGIYIALDVFAKLQKSHSELSFAVVGNGTELERAKSYAAEKGINSITFTGALTGKELIKQYEKADLYIFTSYHEGMPTTVLEAMCFGLPIVTRPVGGLVDFFEDEKMGAIVDSLNADDFVPPINKLLSDQLLVKEISNYNSRYGQEHFLASKVAVNIERIIKKLC